MAPGAAPRAVGLHVVARGDGGAGPPIVLVHGSMDRSAGFARVAGHLADHRVVRYDRRGYGRSRDAGPPAGLSDHVDDLLDVVAASAGDRAAVVVGHSYGGVVALAAAARHPDAVAAVAAFEAPLPWLPGWPPPPSGARAPVPGDDPADVAERFLRRMLGDERWEALPAATRRDRRREGPALAAEMASVGSGPPPFDVDALEVPVVVGHGSRSSEQQRRGAQLLAAHAGRAPFVIDGATHGAHLTHPGEFAAFARTAVAAAR